jgi:hypothetical protein
MKSLIFTGLFLLAAVLFNIIYTDADWGIADYLVAGMLLLTAGFLYETAGGRIKNRNIKLLIGLVIIIVFIAIWIELAVGIFGTRFAGD